MSEAGFAAMADAIARLERRNVVLERKLHVFGALWLLFACWIVTVAAGLVGDEGQRVTKDSVLTVRGLVIADRNGAERVVLGAPLPPPRVLGKRIDRGEDVSGLLVFDADGGERGGYVTDDAYGSVYFTLDNAGQQAALFMAGPEGGVELRLWDEKRNAATLEVGEKGAQLVFSDAQGEQHVIPPAGAKPR